LVWGVNFLKGLDVFGKVNKFYAVYNDVEGLKTTSPVSIKGMKIGSVSKIRLDDDNGRFMVELQIESKYEVPDNSVAYIYSSDIMGSKAIKIKVGNSDVMLGDGDRINSDVENDMLTLLMADLPTMKESLKTIIREVDTTFRQINKLLSDDNIDNLSSGLASLRSALQSAAQLTATLDRSKAAFVSTLDNLDAFIAALRGNTPKIDGIVNSLSDFGDSLKTVSLSGLNSALAEINTLVSRINAGSGNVGKLLNDGELYRHLTQTLKELDLLLADIKANPKKYINISVF
jgi:phospholipid/cholesterol/gamma-HCH transport system substrate-binding protein